MLSISAESVFASPIAPNFESLRSEVKLRYGTARFRRRSTSSSRAHLSSFESESENLSFKYAEFGTLRTRLTKVFGNVLKPRRFGSIVFGLYAGSAIHSVQFGNGGGNNNNFNNGWGDGGDGSGDNLFRVLKAHAEEEEEEEEEDDDDDDEDDEDDDDDDDNDDDETKRKRRKTGNKDDFVVESVLVTNLPTGPGIPSKVRILFFDWN